MASLEDTLLITQVVASGLIVLIMVRQRIKYHIRPLNWLITVFSLAFLRGIVDYVVHITLDLPTPFNEIHFFLFALLLLIFYLFAEYTNGDTPNIYRSGIVFTLFGAFNFAMILALLQGSGHRIPVWPFSNPETFFELPFDIYQFSVWLFSLYIFAKMTYHSQGRKVKLSALFLSIAVFIFWVSSIIELAENIIHTEIPSTITTIPAFLIIFLVYVVKPDFAYSTPIRLYRLMIIMETGPTLMNIEVDPKYRKDNVDSQLVGGVTSSINTILKEITRDAEDSIREVALNKTTFLFSKCGPIFAVVEAERSTGIIKRALQDFAKDFVTKYSDQLENYQGNLGDFAGYEPLIRRYYPFILDADPVVSS